jgi:5-formyltetrahydrofolate cyclo-ligase
MLVTSAPYDEAMRPAPEFREPGGAPEADAAALRTAKSVLRRAVLLRRDLRSVEQRAADDHARTEHLMARIAATGTGDVAAYVSAGSEPGTLELLGWLAATGRRVLLPVLSDGSRWLPAPAWAAYAGPDQLRVGRAGIVEPTGPRLAGEALAEASLVLCPGLAANRAGQRLGRGGGWYDRALPTARDADVCVLLNHDEVFEVIPTQDWDKPVDALVTPAGWLPCSPASPAASRPR